MRPFALALLICAARPVGAAPTCSLTGKPFLEGRVLGVGRPTRMVDARLGQTIEVFIAAPGRKDGRAVVFGDSGAPGRVAFAEAGCGPVEVSWRRVEPRMEHTETDAPNEDIDVYANAVVFGPRHGRWIGFDKLEYFETPIPQAGPRIEVTGAAPSEHPEARTGPWAALGAMRLAAQLRFAGATASTSGAEDAPQGQISERVFRYTLRADDDFLGWLTSFFNVPYLFGSAGKGARAQAERYIGADCADVLVAALRRAGRRDLEYSSVQGLADSLDRVAGPARVGDKQAPISALRVGEDVRPGDLLALDYVGSTELPRPLDHIVAFVKDDGPGGRPDGRLGPEDLVIDSGSAAGLKLEALSHQGDVIVTVLRPRARRAMLHR